MSWGTRQGSITHSDGSHAGFHAGPSTAEDVAFIAQLERARLAAPPPRMSEGDVCDLVGASTYDEHGDVWLALQYLKFPDPYPRRIVRNTFTRQDTPGPYEWERYGVTEWLTRFDAIAPHVKPPAKRKAR